jgi:predicted metalloprotease with PDZ domain
MSRLFLLVAGAALSIMAAVAHAETQPQPLPPAPPIAPPRDIPYPGVLKLSVDATDLDHAIFTIHETVPVAGPGPLVLLYPRWLPGNHSPSGPIDKLASLKVSAGGQPLAWTRDPVDVYAFHVDAPAGVGAIDVDFQYLSAVSTREGHVDMSRDMLAMEWNAVALYPAGYFTRDIRIDAAVTLPKGFTPATALETASTDGQRVAFKTTTFNTLVDSPLMAGRYFRAFDLDPGGPARVTLDVMADAPEDLEVTPEELEAHKNLVRQAYKLYASHHYDHYDFLLWLSDKIGGAGL